MGDEDGHAHRFDHQIETGGVSCSILLKRRDKVGERVREPKGREGKQRHLHRWGKGLRASDEQRGRGYRPQHEGPTALRGQ